MTSYALKASCNYCKRYGLIDDMTMICSHCGHTHEPTDEEVAQRDADFAVWAQATQKRGWRGAFPRRDRS